MRLMFLCIVIINVFLMKEVSAKTPIIWLTDDNRDADNFIQKNNDTIGSDTTNLVLNALKNFDVKFQLVQIPRINILLQSQENICVSNRVKTNERLTDNIFSLPLNLYPGLRLYFLPSNVDLPNSILNEKFELTSLSDLFNVFPEKVLGLSKGRSFGDFLDQQISLLPQKNVVYRSGDGRYTAITKMVLIKRFHFMIEFPTEYAKQIIDFNEELGFRSVAIANTPNYIVGHIACTKTEVGRAFIDEVNQIIRELYRSTEFYQAHSRYIHSDDILQFDKYFQEVFEQDIMNKNGVN